MQVNRFSSTQPLGLIAIAINFDVSAPHCGIVFTSKAGQLTLCDLQWEDRLNHGPPPADQFWTTVRLEEFEIDFVAAFVERVIERYERDQRISYSTVHVHDGFDATGSPRKGVGVTCATFVLNIFERLSLDLAVVETWKARPIQDAKFRQRIINSALKYGYHAVAKRIESEKPPFRVKPNEVFGSATAGRYPVKFVQASKYGATVDKLVRKKR